MRDSVITLLCPGVSTRSLPLQILGKKTSPQLICNPSTATPPFGGSGPLEVAHLWRTKLERREPETELVPPVLWSRERDWCCDVSPEQIPERSRIVSASQPSLSSCPAGNLGGRRAFDGTDWIVDGGGEEE